MAQQTREREVLKLYRCDSVARRRRRDARDPMRVLVVTDESSRGALAATRALGRAGWLVGVACSGRRPLAGTSRYARHTYLIAPPNRSEAMVRDINAAVQRMRYELVLPAGDDWLLSLSFRRDQLTAALPYAPHDVIVRALDKHQLAQVAEHVGLQVPHTVLATPDAVAAWKGPGVVKPATHWLPGRRARTRMEAVVTADPGTLAMRAAEIREAGGRPLLQQVVQGSLMALTVLRARGRAIAYVQQQADRIWPSQGGPTAAGKTVPVDPGLAAGADRLLDALGWCGLAQLQYLLTDCGVPHLIDLNGRLYGSLQLAIAAGVNLPTLWADLGTGRALSSAPVTARPGVTYRWWEGDLRSAVHERRGGLVRDCARVVRGLPVALRPALTARDPLPGATHSARLAGRGVRKVLRLDADSTSAGFSAV